MRWWDHHRLEPFVVMLSVCIPVYQQQVAKLVYELHKQCNDLNIPFEICLIDDFSSEFIRKSNHALSHLPEVRYTELEYNIGRSAIRNRLAAEARYDWLWFLDCDGDATVNPNLAKTFWDARDEHSLLSGGRIYQAQMPEKASLRLHWKWASERELLDPEIRMQDAVTNFLSNNFFIHKNILKQVPFDSVLYGYGYEDTLFAAELVQAGFTIKHINNPVLHDGLESSDVFLKKIEESMYNLFRMKEICREKKLRFPVKSKLILAYRILKLPVIKQLIGIWFIRNTQLWRMQLQGKNPSLKTFDAWRLGVLLNENF